MSAGIGVTAALISNLNNSRLSQEASGRGFSNLKGSRVQPEVGGRGNRVSPRVYGAGGVSAGKGANGDDVGP
eukprot:2026167-Rhodomonas_salina.3